MLVATVFFACMNATVKYLDNFHVFEIIFFRSGVSAFLCISYLRAKGVSLIGNNNWHLFLRSLFGFLGMITFFVTIKHMPLGAAVSLKYLSPIFAAFLAVIFLGEQLRSIQWLFFFSAFAGVLMLKGFDPRIETLYLLIALAGAVFSGLVFVMIRKIGNTEHPMVIVNYFMLFATSISVVLMIPVWKTPTGGEWLLLLAAGVLGYFGQIYMTKSLQLEPATRVASVKYVEVVNSLILGLIWFGEGYGLLSLLGIILIFSSLLLNLAFKQKGKQFEYVGRNG